MEFGKTNFTVVAIELTELGLVYLRGAETGYLQVYKEDDNLYVGNNYRLYVVDKHIPERVSEIQINALAEVNVKGVKTFYTPISPQDLLDDPVAANARFEAIMTLLGSKVFKGCCPCEGGGGGFTPVQLQNSQGVDIYLVSTDTTPQAIPDVTLTDDTGPLAAQPVPLNLVIVGEVDTVVSAAGTTTITPVATPPPTTICPAIIPSYQKNLFGETGFVEGAQIVAGVFNPPAGPYLHIQQPDYSQTDPFLWVLHEWPDVSGKQRWRDTANAVLTYGSATPANNIVKELLFRRMFYVAPSTQANFQAALDYAAAATFGGFDDWRIPTRDEFHLILFDKNQTLSAGTAGGRVPGFQIGSFNEAVTCTTYELGSTSVYALFTGGTRRTFAKAKSSSQNVILIRNW